MNNLNPIIAQALKPFVKPPPVNPVHNSTYRDWGWINGLGVTYMECYHAERSRHEREMEDGIGEHRVKHYTEGNAEHYACSCGFAWKMDYSG